ncbi:hypothetical protein [Halomonas sp. YLGW01]|uniref:hypothetical protein n=1 Tax=Halomonas sp. YLGW01 TaxID=2773308 RepID=UPI0017809C95|nr:hypothetical protein [Halomonas sp. YLGW01]
MQWLNQNSGAISALTGILTLLVWLFYAQLLYNGYIRQRRPRIIINRGSGKNLTSLCLISNMSAEAIFVQHIIAVLETEEGEKQLDIVDYQRSGDEEQQYRSHQGPLDSGAYLHVGSFRQILEHLTDHHGLNDDGKEALSRRAYRALEIRVVAIYGSEDNPIGARRRFRLDPEGDDCRLIPDGLDTQRLASRRQRHRIRQWMQEL